jgi:hypothetical protein
MRRRRFLLLTFGSLPAAAAVASTGPAFDGGAPPTPGPTAFPPLPSAPGLPSRAPRTLPPAPPQVGLGPFAAQAERFSARLAGLRAAAGLAIEPLALWQFPDAATLSAFLEGRAGAGARIRWIGEAGEGGFPDPGGLPSWVLDGGRTGALLVEGSRGRVVLGVPPPPDLDPIAWWRARIGLPASVPLPGPVELEERRLCLAFWEARAAMAAVLLARGLPTPAGLDAASHEVAAADMAAALWRVGEEPQAAAWLERLAHRRLLSGFYHRRLAWTAGGTAVLQAVEDGRRLGDQAKDPDLVRQVVVQRAARHARRADDVAAIQAAWDGLSGDGGQGDGYSPVLQMGRLLEASDPRVAGEAQRWLGSWLHLGRAGVPPAMVEAPPVLRLRAALEAAAAALPEEQRAPVRALLAQVNVLERLRGAARTRAIRAFREEGLAPLLTAAPPGLARGALLDARAAASQL